MSTDFHYESDGVDLTVTGAGARKTFLRKSRELLLSGTYETDPSGLATGDVARLVVERDVGAAYVAACDVYLVTPGQDPVDTACTFVEFEDKLVAYAPGGARTYSFAVAADGSVQIVAPNAKTRTSLAKSN
jgi:hypothetical protein